MPLRIGFHRIAFGAPKAAIPDHDRAPAIFALGNDPFEIAVIDRVILNLNGEALLTRIEAWAFCDCPAFIDAAEFQPEIVMKLPGSVLLDDEAQPLTGLRHNGSAWLRRFRKIPLFPVAAELLLRRRRFAAAVSTLGAWRIGARH